MENIINTIGISTKDIKKVFTPKQFAIIKDNLRAYFVNMGYKHTLKANKTFILNGGQILWKLQKSTERK